MTGDTIVVAGVPVWFNGVDAPKLKTGSGQDAKRWMVNAVRGKTVLCELNGERTYDRWVGTCYVGDINLSAAVISAGHALDCYRYSGGRYRHLETPAATWTTQVGLLSLKTAPRPRGLSHQYPDIAAVAWLSRPAVWQHCNQTRRPGRDRDGSKRRCDGGCAARFRHCGRMRTGGTRKTDRASIARRMDPRPQG